MSQFVEMEVAIKAKVKVEIDSDDVDTSELTPEIIDGFDDVMTDAFSDLEGWTSHDDLKLEAETVDGDGTVVDLRITELLGVTVAVGAVGELETA